MSRKGQIVFTGVMIAALVFVMAVSLIPALKEQTSALRVSLSCDSEGLSAGEVGTCIVGDGYMFFWFFAALSVGLGFVGARRLGFLGGG